MSHLNRPWPEIPRFPGEPRLQGPPHLKRESVFSNPGIVDALDLVNATHHLNSAARRPHIDQQVGKLATVPEATAQILEGLESISSPELMDSNEKRRTASFLHSTLQQRLTIQQAKEKAEDEPAPEIPESPIQKTVNREWSMGLRELPIEKASRRELPRDRYLRQAVGLQVKQNNADDPANIELGFKLFKRFEDPDSSPKELIRLFADLAMAIDKAKIKATKQNHTAEISNIIIAAAGSALADRLPATQESIDALRDFTEEKHRRDVSSGWIIPKVSSVELQVQARMDIAKFAGRFSNFDGLIGKYLGGEEEVKELMDQSIDNLYRFRRYGIKPAYFHDGLLHSANESWVINDPEEIYSQKDWRHFMPAMAVVSLANTRDVEDLTTSSQLTDIGTNGSLWKAQQSYPSEFMLSMLPDGELTIAQSFGSLPIRREFEKAGAPNSYELLKLTHIMRVIDLVVPATLTAEMPQIRKNTNMLGKIRNLRKFANISKLMLPRLKLIGTKPELVEEELDREIAESDKRNLRDHSVIGHVRILPPGYTASPEARAEALSFGIKLAENETWVKKHRRGNIEHGTIKSHQAINNS